MIVLGIETSCDETSAAVYGDEGLLSHAVYYQVVHEKYGGVVPEYASRAHMRALLPTVEMVLEKAALSPGHLDGIAVTRGPGLAGSLLVGLNVAKGMSVRLNCPFVGIDHIEGHIFANFLEKPNPHLPAVCLVASGGHTQLVLVERLGDYRLLGRTRDDAAGEAFDKVGRILGLGYPGGPAIDREARKGNPDAVAFPRTFLGHEGYEFSFSGIKTAVLYYFRELSPDERQKHVADVAASFQKAVVDVLVGKTKRAARELGARSFCVAGGVARNRVLRKEMRIVASELALPVHIPKPEFCTDNAAMIARAGHFYLTQGVRSSLDLAPAPSLTLGERPESAGARALKSQRENTSHGGTPSH